VHHRHKDSNESQSESKEVGEESSERWNPKDVDDVPKHLISPFTADRRNSSAVDTSDNLREPLFQDHFLKMAGLRSMNR